MLRLFQFVTDADDLIERSWRQRNWATFIRVWLLATFCLAVLAFLTPFIFAYLPASIYNVVAWAVTAIFGGTAKLVSLSASDVLWTIALPFCASVGVFTLVLTVPVMLFKRLSGDLSHS
jgi:hypothetical protein